MTPVEELRSAAVLLRQRAEDATPGPWKHTGHGPGYEHMGCGEVYTLGDGVEGGGIAAPAGDCYPRGDYSPDGDMAWIATVHPGVGLALADAMDQAASDFGNGTDEAFQKLMLEASQHGPEHPLLVAARLILGAEPDPDWRPVQNVRLPILEGP